MIKQIAPELYEVRCPEKGPAWFPSMTGCVLWLLANKTW